MIDRRTVRPVGWGTLAAVLAMLLAATPASAIQGGEPSAPGAGGFVARLVVDTGFFGSRHLCTGSLVAPRLVLTAAHCVQSMRPSDWSVEFDHGSPGAATFAVTRVVRFSPEAGATNAPSSTDDLAVLQLDRAVSGRAPVALDDGPRTVDDLVAARSWLTEFGYGTYREDTERYPILPASPVDVHVAQSPKRGALRLDGPAAPSDASRLRSRGTPPGLLVAEDPGFDRAVGRVTGRCMEGDSGGPLVADADSPGGPVLLGVLSLGSSGADDRGRWACYFTRVDHGDAYRGWLDGQIATLG